MTGTCIFGDSATFIYKDCRVLFGDILLYLSWVQPWDIWQQCAARSGEIWLQLTGMICPWAGNLTANFWKLPNPQPIPASARRLNIKAANTARIDLSSTWYLILQIWPILRESQSRKKPVTLTEKPTANFSIHLLLFEGKESQPKFHAKEIW